MAIYAIGDVQGCYDQLRRLLDKLGFDQAVDKLWFCGDLVNRGPQSLQVLHFIRSLGDAAVTVLGNHDLHLLALYRTGRKLPAGDCLEELLDSPDCDELMRWLQHRPLLHYDPSLNAILVHAGIDPGWSLDKARLLARELETLLRGESSLDYFAQMYGDHPHRWSDDLEGSERWRCITNILTRMRFFDTSDRLNFSAKGSPHQHAGEGLTAWFDCASTLDPDTRIFFGHWSTLKVGRYGQAYALDGGCVWGGRFAAFRVDGDAEEWFYHQCTV